MHKFDTSCGLAKKQIDIIKYNVKDKISGQLPLLPESVEMKLFFEGRDAWIYGWNLIQYSAEQQYKISLEVVVKLKKEFHNHSENKHYKFSCNVITRNDIYRPKVSVKKVNA